MKKAVYILGALSADLIIIGLLFKRMHWPAGNEILVASALGTVTFIAVLAAYLYKRDKF